MSATPRPWASYIALLKGPVRAEQFLIQPAGRDGSNDFADIIAELPWQHFDVSVREANAALIVRAVNNFDSLLEAVRVGLRAIDALLEGEECDHDANYCWCGFFADRERLRDAIAAAEATE